MSVKRKNHWPTGERSYTGSSLLSQGKALCQKVALWSFDVAQFLLTHKLEIGPTILVRAQSLRKAIWQCLGAMLYTETKACLQVVHLGSNNSRNEEPGTETGKKGKPAQEVLLHWQPMLATCIHSHTDLGKSTMNCVSKLSPKREWGGVFIPWLVFSKGQEQPCDCYPLPPRSPSRCLGTSAEQVPCIPYLCLREALKQEMQGEALLYHTSARLAAACVAA